LLAKTDTLFDLDIDRMAYTNNAVLKKKEDNAG